MCFKTLEGEAEAWSSSSILCNATERNFAGSVHVSFFAKRGVLDCLEHPIVFPPIYRPRACAMTASLGIFDEIEP